MFRELEGEREIEKFHELLTINLQKFGLEPIHSFQELIDLKYNRIGNNVRFYGVLYEEEIIAAGMLFTFEQVNVIHAQNLSADYTADYGFSPITYLYYKVIEQARRDGFKKLSWGISTEEHGKTLNFSLIRNKESYGSNYQINRTYYKNIFS